MTNPVGRPPINRDAVLNHITGGKPGYVYVSPIKLGEELGISSRSVRRMLREFEKMGLLILKRREGTRSIVYQVP